MRKVFKAHLISPTWKRAHVSNRDQHMKPRLQQAQTITNVNYNKAKLQQS